jgi:hypothetical protein
MRNLLALLAVVLLAFSGTGLLRGWYHVESLEAEPGRSAFRIEIDRAKLAGDVIAAAKGVVRALTRDGQDRTAEPAEK